MLALLGLIPIFLFGYLLLSIIAEKKVEYQGSESTQDTYVPVYYPPPNPSYQAPVQVQARQTQQDVIANIERTNQDMEYDMRRLKLQREQLKTQKTFNPL